MQRIELADRGQQRAGQVARAAVAGTREKLGALGAVITPSSPQEAAAFLKSESAKWEQVIRAADIKAD